MKIICSTNSMTASNARKSNKWKEIEPGIFAGDHKDIKELGGEK